GDRAVLAPRGAVCSGRPRHLLCRLHQHPRSTRLMRVVVIGLGATGDAVVADARAAGHAVTVVEDVPEGPAYSARAPRADAVGAGVVEVPSWPPMQGLASAAALVVPSPGVRPDHPVIAAALAAGVPVRSEVDLAVERVRARDPRPRLVAVTGTNGKTTV